MFVLVGQILNSRGRFGPMMWAPIANNVIAVVVLVVYLLVFGPATEAEQTAGFTSGQEALLGLGSTFGIVAQLLILLPFLRSAGFTFRPRFDLKDTGLGHTLRLGVWTVLSPLILPPSTSFRHLHLTPLATPCGSACGPPLRGGQPDRLHRRRPARVRWYGGRGRRRHRHRLHGLCPELPDRDGPALGDHGLPGHGDPPPPQRPGERRRPGRPRPHPRDVAAQRAGRRPALRPPAAGDRPRHRARGVGLGCRPRRVRAVRADALPVRHRPAVLHRPLPDLARLLRPRAHAHGLLDPVRHRRPPTSRRPSCWCPSPAPRTPHPRWCSPTPRRTSSGRCCPTSSSGTCSVVWRPGAWRGSWCVCSSPPASRPRRRTWRPWPSTSSASDPNQAVAAVRAAVVTALDVLVFVVVARLLRLREVTDVLDTVTRRLRS